MGLTQNYISYLIHYQAMRYGKSYGEVLDFVMGCLCCKIARTIFVKLHKQPAVKQLIPYNGKAIRRFFYMHELPDRDELEPVCVYSSICTSVVNLPPTQWLASGIVRSILSGLGENDV